MDLIKGILAGVAGGLAGTYVKTLWEEQFPVRDENTDSPPAEIAERVSDKPLTEDEKKSAESGIHWTFGTVVGAVYGGLAEAAPAAAAGAGLPFATTLWLGTHATTLPATDLEPAPDELPKSYARNEFLGHMVYGVTVELVRSGVRRILG